MKKNHYPKAQNPLLLRLHRLNDAFSKSDDERDFYLDRIEGFILFADIDKGEKEIEQLELEIEKNQDRYLLFPKMTFYETKKFMESFINEKIYDIDTKEKLLDIIQSKEARENFLEFIYDHLTELEKWQQYYLERMRIRIIEWLRLHEVLFVFEEDLDLSISTVEKVKQHLFDAKVGKDISHAREVLMQKAKTYYSNEALNPRPKRGRPPKQQVKADIEPQLTGDIYTTVPPECRAFLYLTDVSSGSSGATFSSRHATKADLLASLRGSVRVKVDSKLEALSQRLESLRQLSTKLYDFPDTLGSKEQRTVRDVLQQERPFAAQKEESLKEGSALTKVIQEALPHDQKKRTRALRSVKPFIFKKVTPITSKKKK